jgi:hypothetical protein
MSQPLPPEVRVVTTPTGVRYVLPWKPVLPEVRWRIRLAGIAGVLAWALAVCLFLQPAPPPVHHGKGGGGGPPFGFLLLVGGSIALAYAAAQRFTHGTAEFGPGGLVLSEWRGPFPQRRERSLDRIRALVVHPLPGAATEAGVVTAPAGGVIEVVCEGIQPVWWGHGYSRALLGPLAAELAERCRVPHRQDRREDRPPPAVPPFAEQAVRDRDTADVAERPANSRVLLDRSPDRLTLTVPPPVSWGTDKAPGFWLVSGVWILIPVAVGLAAVVQVVRHGVPQPGAWLAMAGMLAIGPVVVLIVRHNLGARTRLTVRRGRLTRLKTSPVLPSEYLTWPREEIFALRTVTSAGGKGPPRVAVTLFPAAGEQVKLVESTARDEMDWIATVLRSELRVPAVPGLPVTSSAASPIPPPAEARAAPAAVRPRPLLPAPIRLVTTTTGTRYVLPLLRLPRRLRRSLAIALLMAFAALGAGVCLCSGALLPDWVREVGVARGLGGLILVGLGGLLANAALSLFVQRASVEVGPGELRCRRRMGLMVTERAWPITGVRRLVTRRLAVGSGVPQEEARGQIEVVGDGETSCHFGEGYPVTLLRPLAQELADRLRVPEEAGDAPSASPEAPPRPETTGRGDEDVPEEDVADREKPPVWSRAVLEQADAGLTLTLPPTGWPGDRTTQAVLPFAVAAGVFVLLNALAAVRLAVAGPGDGPGAAGVAAWLLGSGAPASVLALWLARRARRRTTLLVTEAALAVVRSGSLLRERRQEWPRAEMVALRLGPAVPSPRGGKGFALRLWLRDGRAVNVLTGDDEAELRWLATVLRQALHVPAVAA